MKIANPIYDVVFKYLMENNAIAKDILSAILQEDIVLVEPLDYETTQKLTRIVRYIGKVIMRHSNLLYVISMEDLMEAEMLRDKKRLENAKNAKIEAEKAKVEAEKAKDETDLENNLLKIEVENLRQQLQNKQ